MEEAANASEGKRILYSDDEADLCVAMQKYLEANGYDVRLAPLARDALEAARSWQPHLIVTDLMKPEVSGYDLLRWLKADEETKGIPVLVLSAGCQNPETRQRVLDMGAWAAWAKPFDPKDLLQAVSDLLRT